MTRKPPDMRKRFAAHLEASQKRDAWVKRGLEYQQAGRIEDARKALRKAERWDFKRRELEI